MKSRITSSRRVVIVIAVCCSMMAIAHAGNFSSSAGYVVFPASYGPNGSGGGYIFETDFGLPDLAGGNAGYDGNVTNLDFNCDSGGDYCWWSGDLSSGSIMFRGNSYSFQGTITSGSIQGDYSLIYPVLDDEYEVFTFAGTWNNGFTGVGSAVFDYPLGWGQGEIYVNTTTPEPSGLLLFGSSVLAMTGVLRRRI